MKITPLIMGFALAILFVVPSEAAMNHSEIRTYLPFTYPVEPTKIVTISDMNLSYALGTTLVEWGKGKQITSGIAAKWEITTPRVYRFTLRPGIKWSNGTIVKSAQIKEALESAFKRYPDDLRSLSSLIETIRASAENIIDFHLKVDATSSNLLGKLTEPQYGIFQIDSHGKIDPQITVGAFYLKSQSQREISLNRNPNWVHFLEQTPEKIIIRRPPEKLELAQVFKNDSWPNVIETSSMIAESLLGEYTASGYSVWKRPLDKMLLLMLGKRLENSKGLQLVQFLKQKINKTLISQGLTGLAQGDQAFPKGFQLYDPNFQCPASATSLPHEFSKQPLKIVYSSARVNEQLRKNLSQAIHQIMGVQPEFIQIDLSDLAISRKRTDYDLYFGTMGLADPDPEGAMSYYFEGDLPVIPSAGKNFIEKLDEARSKSTLAEKLSGFRSLLTQALCNGHFLPLFHLSTIGIAKPEVDLSKLSDTDESVTFSKLQIKGNPR